MIKHHLKISFLQFLFLIWIVYLYITVVPNLLDPYRNHLYFKQFLSSVMFMYLIPLMMIAELNIVFLRKYIKLCYILLLFYIVFALFFSKYDDENFTLFVEGIVVLLMTWVYHAPKKRRIIIISLIIVLIGMMLAARRNRVVYFGGGFVLALVVNILQNNSYTNSKKTTLVILSLAMGIGLYFTAGYFSDFFIKMGTGMDSREKAIEDFIYDFDSHPTDWIWGRGLYGQYDGGLLNTDTDLGLRDGIENGYLFLILKGGGVWLFLLTLIALKAIYNGCFKSRNLLCKGFAMIILLYYIDMIGLGVPQNSLKYMMVFIAIAGCNTPWLLGCTDEYLANEIGLK